MKPSSSPSASATRTVRRSSTACSTASPATWARRSAMHVRFAPPELKQIDALRCEALALPLFSDERPLSGALGLCDWRLCGFLSRMAVAGRITGEALETVLIPARPKLSLDKLFVFGLGARAEFDAG